MCYTYGVNKNKVTKGNEPMKQNNALQSSKMNDTPKSVSLLFLFTPLQGIFNYSRRTLNALLLLDGGQ
jgi:hypothetical protein